MEHHVFSVTLVLHRNMQQCILPATLFNMKVHMQTSLHVTLFFERTEMNEIKTATINEVVTIKDLEVAAYTIPTATPESDGKLEWDSTTLIIVQIIAGHETGLGYTYADASVAYFIQHTLRKLVLQKNAYDIESINGLLTQHIRNSGNCGIAAMAISAIDNALWDLKAKLLGLPLCELLGKVKDKILVYGSGGFTSYADHELEQQFADWADEGILHMKMKIGREPNRDNERVRAARKIIGDNIGLFVDANGAYSVKQSINKANEFRQSNVSWFEEPVASSNLEGLNFIRQHTNCMNVTAGEYGYNLVYFKQMLSAGAVDILQADATRCGGITTFLKAGCLSESYQIPFSSHCAPSLHLHAAIALSSFYISEYFFDHVRIESMLFDGFSPPVNGYMFPDLSRPGLGIEFKKQDAEKFKI